MRAVVKLRFGDTLASDTAFKGQAFSMRRSSSLPKDGEGSKMAFLKEEHGHLQSLSSPILSKINDGFICFKDALTGKAKQKYTAFQVVEGGSSDMPVCIASASLSSPVRLQVLKKAQYMLAGNRTCRVSVWSAK